MLKRLSFFPVWLSIVLGSAWANQERLPNIVVFLADDLGWGDLGCYGHPAIQTPNLDRFATQGIKFMQAYSASGVCSPSRSAILTGRTPYRNGVFTWIPEGCPIHLRKEEISVATLLKREGYDTCHVGKWHLNGHVDAHEHLDQPQPSDHGFDWYLATQNNAFPNHMNPTNFVRNGAGAGRLEGPSAVVMVEEAIRWLKNRRHPSRPFFVNVWTHEPHKPIESDQGFLKRYPGLEPDLAQHHANVTQLDHAFGLLMKAIEKTGEADNTFVVFTSDNGPEGSGLRARTRGSTGGLRGRKRDVYEGGIRVPAIVRWPGKTKAGSVSQEPVIGTDIFATLCDVSGILVPADRTIDGVSLVPALQGKSIQRPLPLYWRSNLARNGMEIAIRIGDWKLITDYGFLRFKLFNLREDPAEKNDLSQTNPQAKMNEMTRALWNFERKLQAERYTWPEVALPEWNMRLKGALSQ